MNKIASYLNQHLLGEVTSAKSILKRYSTDGGVLAVDPEIVAFPRITTDIRKIARFTWQLAEKGHIVGLTARGFGGDVTGAAIGKGIVIDMSKQYDAILEVAVKDKLVHAQAGAPLARIDEALRWQGLTVPGVFYRGIRPISVAGAIANDSLGVNGRVADSIKRLEVVLANGDVIETGRINKREVSKKLGLQTFEGEIYRKVSGLLEDNEELIKRLAEDEVRDNVGYKRIAEIKDKDGSIDLTPLFVGSQGTLGIISEVVLTADFLSLNEIHAVITTGSVQEARDLGEQIVPINPAELTVIDGELLRRAAENGAHFPLVGAIDQVGAVIYVRFNDFSDRAQGKKLKKLKKLLAKQNSGMVDSTERDAEDFRSLAVIGRVLQLGTNDDFVALPILNGASIPSNRCEEFEASLHDLADRHHVELPTEFNVVNCIYKVYPRMKLDSVSDKQRFFKILTEYAALVDHCGGAVAADGAEGRLRANAAWATLDDDQVELYQQVREIFDPFGTLNPGVKQKNEMRSLVAMLRSHFDAVSVL